MKTMRTAGIGLASISIPECQSIPRILEYPDIAYPSQDYPGYRGNSGYPDIWLASLTISGLAQECQSVPGIPGIPGQ